MKKFLLSFVLFTACLFQTGSESAISASNPVQRVVIEQLTSPNCPYCPAGIVKFEQYKREYKEKVICINIHHTNSPMNISKYSSIMNGRFHATPQASINRQYNQLYTSSYLEYLQKSLEKPVRAEVSLSAYYTDKTKNTITAAIGSRFFSNYENAADFRISLVITENGVVGTNSAYDQKNYYSGKMIMGGFHELPNPIPAAHIVYDHVAREIVDDIGQQFPSGITANIPYVLTYTMDLPDNLMNKDNLELTALLIDNQTGVIVNAAQILASSIEDTAPAETSPIVLIHDNKPLTNNQEIVVKEINPELGTMKVPLTVKNTGFSTLSIKVKRTEVSLVKGSINQFCWGEVCLLPEVSDSPEPIILAPNGTSDVFYAEYIPAKTSGISTITYEFYSPSNPTISSFVTMKFDETAALGVESVQNQVRISLQNQQLIVESEAAENIEVYTLTGTLIYQSNKSVGIETFHLSAQPSGVWIVKGSSGWVKKVQNRN